MFTSYDTVHTHYDTVDTHFEIVHTHFDTGLSMFTSYHTVHTHITHTLTQFTHTLAQLIPYSHSSHITYKVYSHFMLSTRYNSVDTHFETIHSMFTS